MRRFTRPAQEVQAFRFLKDDPVRHECVKTVYFDDRSGAIWGVSGYGITPPPGLTTGFGIWRNDGGWRVLFEGSWVVFFPNGRVETWEHESFLRTFRPAPGVDH